MRSTRALMAVVFVATLTVGLPAAAQSPELVPHALEPTAQLPLEGTTWRLRDYRYKGVDRSAGPEVAAWMTLRAGKIDASGGCTTFRGSYGIMGSALTVKPRGLRDNHCAEQTTIVQLGMVDGLRRAASFKLLSSDETRGTQLLVHSAQGLPLLRFEADDAAVLENAEWQLEAFTVAGERILAEPGQPAVLTFRPERSSARQRSSSGTAVGSSGCNGFLGGYFRHADVLSFGELERTDAPCSPAQTAQEAAITAVLDATSLSLRLPPDRLILTSNDGGDALELVSSTPLEGSTWLLSHLPDSPSLASTVTLRLAGGQATGEGPCGAYSATYATNGVFLTFRDVEPAGGVECGQAQAENALLAALRSTVLLDRSQPQMRFLDARGEVVARFKNPGGP
jgi:heat shock protein HslJ